MEFLGSFIEFYCRRSVDMNTNVMLICPGSPTKPRMSNPSVVELVIEKGTVNGRILTLEGDTCNYLKFKDSLKKQKQEEDMNLKKD
jgi:uncharacterized protein